MIHAFKVSHFSFIEVSCRCSSVLKLKNVSRTKRATIRFPGGGGRSIFEINNFGRWNKYFTSWTVPYKHVTKCENFSAPPSPVEINNLPTTNTPAPPPRQSNGAPLTIEALNYKITVFTHLKLCLATATHHFKWVKNYFISQISIKIYGNLANLIFISLGFLFYFLEQTGRLQTWVTLTLLSKFI